MASTDPLPEGYIAVGNNEDQVFVPQTGPSKDDRLGIPPDVRIYTWGLTTFGAVTMSGIIREYGRAALRFRAENAHRLPRSEKNWFYYHRAKSLYALKEAIPYGTKLGLRMAPWAMGFLLMEQGVDHARGGSSKDFLSTIMASISIAGLYSVWTRSKIPEAGRMVKYGIGVGLTFGLVQDAVSLLSGKHLSYVDSIKRAFGSANTESPSDTPQSQVAS